MNFTRSDFPASFQFGLASLDDGAGLNGAGFDICRVPIPWGDTGLLARCDAQIDALLADGVRPCGVLDRSALPLEIMDSGGWSNRNTAKRFADFAEMAMQRFGDRLYSVSTGVDAQSTHQQSERAKIRGIHHQLLAHGMAVQVMRGLGAQNLGLDLGAEHACIEACAAFTRAYPTAWLETHGPHLPERWEGDLNTIASAIEWCGSTMSAPDSEAALQLIPSDHRVYVTLSASNQSELSDKLAQAKELAAKMPAVQGVFVSSPEITLLGTLKQGLGHSTPWSRPSATVHAHWNLVADIGGTNTRLGVVIDGQLTSLHKHPTGSRDELHAALHDLCATEGTPPQAVVAAGAGPVRDGTIHLTNAHLTLSESELAAATESKHTFVINDFTAAAWSVAEVGSAEVEALQGPATPPAGTRLVVGPGTGLGVGALIYSEGHFHTASGEGGHMGLSPRHRDEVDVFEAARQLAPECFFGDSLALEAEMFLSGTGLPILYQAVGLASGQIKTPVKTAKDILQTAKDGTDACAVRTAKMFTEHLGAIMGDLAVALVPRGGVFLVGGVAEKNRWLFDQDFLDAFNAGGRFSSLRQEMNVYISRQDEFGIVGANNFCKNALAH